MPQAPALTGQDIAEAEGAVTRLLERALAPTGTSRHQYVVLRVLTGRGPFTSPGELREYLAGQPGPVHPGTRSSKIPSAHRGSSLRATGTAGMTGSGGSGTVTSVR